MKSCANIYFEFNTNEKKENIYERCTNRYGN